MGVNSHHTEALYELLYQLADDDFINAYRGSEWLGLAPHIEEDVAFSSISQDTMGHAAMYYNLLEQLGVGKANDISHLRQAAQFRNANILEEKNGTGTYTEEPKYDWAFTVVRQFLYNVAKKIRLQSLRQSSYEPLAHTAAKIAMEQTYHLMHWEVWFRQLMLSTEEARIRMEKAIDRVWRDMGGVLTLGPYAEEMTATGLIESETLLKKRFMKQVEQYFKEINFTVKGEPGMSKGDGRRGEHTDDLTEALNTLSEVYRSDPHAAGW